MTIFRLKNNPATGAFAIYSVPSHASTDDTPLDDPFLDPSRLQFHSDIYAPSTTEALTQTVTATIPTQSSSTKYGGQINLFAHGKGVPCMVDGEFEDPDDAGTFVAFNGHVPVKVTAAGHATWLYLAATSTHVVLGYHGITSAGFSAFNVLVRASAYDFLTTGTPETSDPGLPLLKHVRNSYLQLGRGKFDTRRRQPRRSSVGDTVFALGPTISIIGRGITGSGGSYVQNEIGWRWRYACGNYVKQTTTTWNGQSTDGGNYAAEVVQAKR